MKVYLFVGWILSSLSFAACPDLAVLAITNDNGSLDAWLKAEAIFAEQNIISSVSRTDAAPGRAIAAPSKSNPDYFYHWVRDAALFMSPMIDSAQTESDSSKRDLYFRRLGEYARAARDHQLTSNLSGEAEDRGLGEPKFLATGGAYNEPWGRPQNDGPALRALTLLKLDPQLPSIKVDLNYLEKYWWDSSVDLWEEVNGHHFYTRMVQQAALKRGAEVYGDPKYIIQLAHIRRALEDHWDSSSNFIKATLGRVGGLEDKKENLDVAVILGVLHSMDRTRADGFYGPTDSRVLCSVAAIENRFRHLYPINENEFDRSGERMAPAIGRYPEDIYDGNGFSGGNPWNLATNAMAEIHYEAGLQWQNEGKIEVNVINLPFFNNIEANVSPGEVIDLTNPKFSQIMGLLIEKGDQYLRRVRFHAAHNGQLSEQINRFSGFQQGAGDLTWSYASLLTAYRARQQLLSR